VPLSISLLDSLKQAEHKGTGAIRVGDKLVYLPDQVIAVCLDEIIVETPQFLWRRYIVR